MENFDLGIIGGGPAGYTAALQASYNGEHVVIFEKDEIGGICLNRGCIPTKTILHSSEVYKSMLTSSNIGIDADNIKLNYTKILEQKNQVVEKLRKSIELALKNAKVNIIRANATIENKTTIKAENRIFNCKRIISATGSSPRLVKGLEFDHEFLLSSDDILNLVQLPKSILIVGSGAIGIEWARIMSNFGVETKIIELANNLLPIADKEVSKRIERIFKTDKIKFYTNTSIDKIENKTITLSNGEVITPEKVLVAIGRTPNINDKIEGVTYIGDVTGQIQLAHFAIKEALENISKIKFDKKLVPSVVYGTPEIAWVGKREQDLEPGTYQKAFTLISSLGKAQCDRKTDGFIKLLARNNEIIGCHIISEEASAMAQQILIAMQNHINIDKLKEICFPHPTYSEGLFDSLLKVE